MKQIGGPREAAETRDHDKGPDLTQSHIHKGNLLQ
jgi:hypothetical protein